MAVDNDKKAAVKTKRASTPVDTRIKGYILCRNGIDPNDVEIVRSAEEAMALTEQGYKAKKFVLERKKRGAESPKASF